MNFRPLLRQLVGFAVVSYSLVVMASVIPFFHRLSSVELVPYYLVVPGYALTTLLSEGQGIAGKAFYSVAWSVALVASVYSLQSVAPQSEGLPIPVIVPALTLVFFTYNRFHRA